MGRTTVSESKPSLNVLLPYEGFADWVPHRISKRQILHMSLGSKFPPFVKAYPRAIPLWREGDVIAWIVANYAGVLPDYCDRLVRHGFSCPPFSMGDGLGARSHGKSV